MQLWMQDPKYRARWSKGGAATTKHRWQNLSIANAFALPISDGVRRWWQQEENRKRIKPSRRALANVIGKTLSGIRERVTAGVSAAMRRMWADTELKERRKAALRAAGAKRTEATCARLKVPCFQFPGKSNREIAKHLGISGARVCQLRQLSKSTIPSITATNQSAP